ncbi:MAG: VanZ family protein [Candidatus Hydrogenedentes bacterium]|nr:VanZ family protein [Candidatus Hydrogenedentota bacterium]
MPRRYQIATMAYAAFLLFVACSPHLPQRKPPVARPDLYVHAILYAGLAAVIARGLFRSSRHYSKAVQFWLPVAAASGYGLLLEAVQLLIPSRSFGWDDFFADTAGALAAQIALHVYWKRRPSVKIHATESPPKG